MGGGIAANVAIDHPEAVKALVLFAPQTSAEAGDMSKLVSGFIVRTMFNSIISIGSRLPFVMRLLVAYSFSDMDYAKSYDVSRISDPLKIDGTGAGIAIMSSHTRGTDVEAFGRLDIPVCIITASDDKVANKSNLEALINSGAPQLVTYLSERVHNFQVAVNVKRDAKLKG